MGDDGRESTVQARRLRRLIKGRLDSRPAACYAELLELAIGAGLLLEGAAERAYPRAETRAVAGFCRCPHGACHRRLDPHEPQYCELCYQGGC